MYPGIRGLTRLEHTLPSIMDEPKGGGKKDSAQASAAGQSVCTEIDLFDSPSLVVNGKT